MIHDLVTITLRPGVQGKALAKLGDTIAAAPWRDRLAGCFHAEIGLLNQILMLRSFDDEAEAAQLRAAHVRAVDPFGIQEFTTAVALDPFISFPAAPLMKPGRYGPFYEVRDYIAKPGSIEGTTEIWAKALPARLQLSPLLVAMHGSAGNLARFVHIWPYPSLDERLRIRNKAIETGVWPPPGGADRLVSQQTGIFLPAAFSPLQ
jgi:hypothetical protein